MFERGHTTADDGAGSGPSIVHELVDARGRELDVTASDAGDARFETGVDPPAGSGSGAGGRS